MNFYPKTTRNRPWSSPPKDCGLLAGKIDVRSPDPCEAAIPGRNNEVTTVKKPFARVFVEKDGHELKM